MATTILIRNIDRDPPVPDCTCFICGASVKLLRSMQHPVSGKWTAGCETCFQKSRQTAPAPISGVSPIDTDECAAARLEGFIAGWRVWEAVHLPGFIASPLAFHLDALTDAILSTPAPEPPTTEPESDSYNWEADPRGLFVLDLNTVVSRLDFALVPTSELSDIERAQMERERRRAVVEAMAA